MATISIDMGGTRIKIAALQDNKIIKHTILEARAESPTQENLERVTKTITDWAEDIGKPEGIALAIPGIVDRQNKRVRSINGKFLDAPNFHFSDWASANFNCPFVIENDARAALLGEWHFGAGRGSSNIVMLTLGTGIGTAVIIDGKPIQGAQCLAGNLGGHLILERDAINACNCLAFGCAESSASSWAHKDDLQDTWRAAYQGCAEATLEIERILKTWALLIHNMILSFSPDRIIIGGGISARGQNLLTELNTRLPDNIWYQSKDLAWQLAKEPDFAALYGGYVLLNESSMPNSKTT